MATLLSRAEFNRLALERDEGRCVHCGKPAVDVHHIMERKLFPDGGYYLDNAASLCSACHLDAEYTLIACETLRIEAGIRRDLLPPSLPAGPAYDKWGNELLPDGRIRPGPMFSTEQVQKILRRTGKISRVIYG